MLRDSIKKTGSFLLASSVLLSAVSFFPVSIAAQEKTEEKTAQQNAQKDDKKNKKKKDSKKQKETAATQTSNPKGLTEKENPAMIGKRNVNGGTDKLFGWLGGSKEKEMAIGRQLSLEVEQQSKLVEDPLITEYVNRVGQNVVLHSDAKMPFTIKVIDSDEVNAFALPGGYFYVNKGLILAADNEAELAGVMAHEIAHVAARHAMENQGKGALINYGAIAGIIFGGPILSGVLQNGGGILAGLASLKFSRGAEMEADRLGVQYLYASGYDPTAMSTMFEKLASKSKKKPSSLSKLFSTHPQSLDRRDTSLQLVSRFDEKEEYVISTSEFQRVKSHLLRISNARAGVTSDIDEGDPGKPTLKRRAPEADSDGTSSSDGSSSSDGPPQLKKRSEPTESNDSDGPPVLQKRGEPQASPSPKK